MTLYTKMRKLCLPMLPILCGIALLNHPVEAGAEDALQRIKRFRRLDSLIYAPRVTHSLEWAIGMDVKWPPSD